MASNLTITTQLNSDFQTEVIATVTPGGSIPTDIFIYENTGGTTLGCYIGVCNINEYQRLQLFTGVATPIFGNKFVRWTSANITIPPNTDLNTNVNSSNIDEVTNAVNSITNGVKLLSSQFSSSITTVTNTVIP